MRDDDAMGHVADPEEQSRPRDNAVTNASPSQVVGTVTTPPTRPPPDADVPAFSAIGAHADLVQWSERYAARLVDATDLAVALPPVDWEVSTRAKRRAAAVLHPRIDGATLGELIDWTDRPMGSDGPPSATVRLTWEAARTYDRADWAQTLRHELIHLEQFQRYGATGHDRAFRERAAALDTTVRCEHFATPKYVLTCSACERVVARRFRDCKLVRRHEEYRSSCCDRPLDLRRTGAAAD